jgi:hypothetical protein
VVVITEKSVRVALSGEVGCGEVAFRLAVESDCFAIAVIRVSPRQSSRSDWQSSDWQSSDYASSRRSSEKCSPTHVVPPNLSYLLRSVPQSTGALFSKHPAEPICRPRE